MKIIILNKKQYDVLNSVRNYKFWTYPFNGNYYFIKLEYKEYTGYAINTIILRSPLCSTKHEYLKKNMEKILQ
jgi:hypothetical protein